ncbi:uncharacterized protein TNCT_296651 [Trichonephila clavata]|uniref:Uncharacterized protein n=1 Tax=Trichonephila clavata TaxID=2740835 RepID=A0A8X6HLH0_TRICU|nr:uncharacterized protein TNCT_296651 [Trichonephila clavata]
MFSNLFRFITPIALKAGKYLGKHLLSTGSKVMSDVVSGSSLKDSARSRFRETSKKIKDDIMHKIQSGSGIKRKKSHKENHSHVSSESKETKRNRHILVVIWIPERVHA